MNLKCSNEAIIPSAKKSLRLLKNTERKSKHTSLRYGFYPIKFFLANLILSIQLAPGDGRNISQNLYYAKRINNFPTT